ncbi:MAG: hypothetical protein GTO41_10765, partial [Burkholderiales bacterium]|nr:hypothetical protein [Burkholderiales bacterium]
MRAERAATVRPYLGDVEMIWDSLETQINDLAVDIQHNRGPVTLHRPYRQPYSPQSIIDQTIP